MNFKQILVTEFDIKVFIEPIEGMTAHIEQKTGFALRPVVLTGWVNKGRFEIERADGKRKYVSLQDILK